MTEPTFKFQDFLKQASELLPGEQFRQGVNKNINALVTNALDKMDLVRRDEFDAQTEKLRRCEEQLAALEEQIKALEADN